MNTTDKPFEIRFYNEEMFDNAMLFMEAAADCLLGEMSSRVMLENHTAEHTVMGSGTPSNTRDVNIGSGFYEVMKQAFAETPADAYLTFIIETKIKTAETPAGQLEATHRVRVKNPMIGTKREDWPEWEDPQFEIPELLYDEAPKWQDDFTISITPQYSEGDMFDFLDETAHFVLTVLSGAAIKKFDVTAKLMHEWREEKLSVEVNPKAKGHEITIDLSANLLDQVKEMGSYSHGEYEKFDYFFEIEITGADDKKHKRKVSVQLPNPYYEGIAAEKDIARDVLAEVFKRKYNEDIAELDIESQEGWWAWRKDGVSFQYGWKDNAIMLYRYLGAEDYDADADEVSEAIDEINEFAAGTAELVYVDNYFVLKYEFSPEELDADDLEKKLDEFEELADSDEVSGFLAAYEGES
ncbi:hypothetical protein HYN59_06095 [Flavobacterium album]|uniref:Uncharacterized protein n=1 Tax=Flavobacterium album TaxID=2175091 RepID=A0A2S1QWC0_9FLAO|nr:hypothetical protein [Flavobacterium album]AWH84717.1 hypothetical protein HYN59_06095 [Flavobacterium album]